MRANRRLVLCALVVIVLAGGIWLAFRSAGDATGGDAGQPQTPMALDASDQAQAQEVAALAVRETIRAPEFAATGQPRSIELVSLSASRDSQGNWYGKLWTASGTGMTPEGKSFKWSLQLKHEGGEWSSASAATVDLNPR